MFAGKYRFGIDFLYKRVQLVQLMSWYSPVAYRGRIGVGSARFNVHLVSLFHQEKTDVCIHPLPLPYTCTN